MPSQVPRDDPHTLKGMRSAAIRCLSCIRALVTSALEEAKWYEARDGGDIQRLIAGLKEAIELGQFIEREPRLTLGLACTFGNVTAKNAHVAALRLAERVQRIVEMATFATGTLDTDELRGKLWSLPGYNNRFNFEAWLAAVESEADRASLAAGETSPPSQTAQAVYITLNQAAALVNRAKRTLERRKGKMPPPAIEGGGGKPDEWLWSDLRPWLESEFGRLLPEIPPHAIRH